MTKIPTSIQTDLDNVRATIAKDITKYSLANPYGSTARNTKDDTVITAKVIGIVFGDAQSFNGGEKQTPVYVVTDKKTRCKISIDDLNALSIGSTVTMTKKSDIIDGQLRHWFTFDAVQGNPEVKDAAVMTTAEGKVA